MNLLKLPLNGVADEIFQLGYENIKYYEYFHKISWHDTNYKVVKTVIKYLKHTEGYEKTVLLITRDSRDSIFFEAVGM